MLTVQNCVRTALALVVLIAAAAIVPATAAAGRRDDVDLQARPGRRPLRGHDRRQDHCRRPVRRRSRSATRARTDAPVDCFYLYPTQSEQPGPNSEPRQGSADQARRRPAGADVLVRLRRLRADVPAGDATTATRARHNPSVETAYQSAKSAFEDYLENYNDGRGFIMLGHSQGSAHTARLIEEIVDKDPELRKRFVGAIAPGANIAVPIGEPVGGLFDNVPACTEVGEYGCVIAFSTYNDVPGPNAAVLARRRRLLDLPRAALQPDEYEVMCTNPALLDGGDGTLLPLVNFDYLARRARGRGDGGALARPARLLPGRVHAPGRRPLAQPVEGRPAGRHPSRPRSGSSPAARTTTCPRSTWPRATC